MNGLDGGARINLTKASVLVGDCSQHSVDVLAQIMKGFGVAEVHRCVTREEADKCFRNRKVDLIVFDPSMDNRAGYDFLQSVRLSRHEPNCYVPIVLVSGHVRTTDLGRARDTGANFFVVKPITPQILLQRILWVVRDNRPWVEFESYVGPDRRFKFEGAPIGKSGRRSGDTTDPIGDADTPNMSQTEIDSLIKPQRVLI